MRRLSSVALGIVLGVLCASSLSNRFALAQEFPILDFSDPSTAALWQPTHDIESLNPLSEGLEILSSGSDPYCVGPVMDFPVGLELWMDLKVLSSESGSLQVFYAPEGAPMVEGDSVRMPIRKQEWNQVRVPLPSLGEGYRLRIDPPGESKRTLVAHLAFSERKEFSEPEWPRPYGPRVATQEGQGTPANPEPWRVVSGDLEILHGDTFIEDYLIRVAGQPFAAGLSHFLVGYVAEGEVQWIDSHLSCWPGPVEGLESGGFRTTYRLRDERDADWTFVRTFKPGKVVGSIDVVTTLTLQEDREVLFAPLFVILPGLGSFGDSKHQAVFSGVEYLADEPSSSTADLVGPEADRRIPAPHKITFPLMALQSNDRYLGVMWETGPDVSPLFDSPDRLFSSGAHLMGLILPGSEGAGRKEGSPLPYTPLGLKAGVPVGVTATLVGGPGATIVPAVEKYVEIEGLPPLPGSEWTKEEAVKLLASGWLDSEIQDEGRFRHAVFPHPSATHPAGDAVYWMRWLAVETKDGMLASRLIDSASEALGNIPAGQEAYSGVSHVKHPVLPLLTGKLDEGVEAARTYFARLSERFIGPGRVVYSAPEGGPDYGRTHFEREANGLAGQAVEQLLLAALYLGEEEKIQQAVDHLRGLQEKFQGTVPRGAQTWEIPLHTPDILASAYLTGAFSLGYEITGEMEFLEAARYWAWTGVPFVYLRNPTGQAIGPYATIPVLGATQWVAPVWMGLPVQWCGLVYSHALYRFQKHDPQGPWKQLADGITLSGLQQTYPMDHPDYSGLLPDSVTLSTQTRNLAAINPGTLQASAIHLWGGPLPYDFHYFRKRKITVHAPGSLEDIEQGEDFLSFQVVGWSNHPYWIMVTGLGQGWIIEVGDQTSPVESLDENSGGRVYVLLQGSERITLRLAS